MQPIPVQEKPPAARVLVVGASGFIGTRLVARLHRQGGGVIAADLELPRTRLDGVAYHQIDVREPLPAALGADVSRIYNLAAVHRTPGHPPHAYYETNVLGAVNVTTLAEACGIERSSSPAPSRSTVPRSR